MRASEFLTEGEGKMHHNHSQATPGVSKSRDIGGYDRIYHLNRLMMAMGMADGKSQDAVEMDNASFAEKYNTVHPYTEEEHNMFVSATKTIPTDRKNVVPYSKSQESTDTNTTSTVKPFKGYKRK
jgi:hypothetical protein